MIVLLHSHDPWDIFQCDNAHTKVSVVGDVADLLDEGVKIRRHHFIDSSDETCGRKLILVSRRT
jgi:hypothetical protein